MRQEDKSKSKKDEIVEQIRKEDEKIGLTKMLQIEDPGEGGGMIDVPSLDMEDILLKLKDISVNGGYNVKDLNTLAINLKDHIPAQAAHVLPDAVEFNARLLALIAGHPWDFTWDDVVDCYKQTWLNQPYIDTTFADGFGIDDDDLVNEFLNSTKNMEHPGYVVAREKERL